MLQKYILLFLLLLLFQACNSHSKDLNHKKHTLVTHQNLPNKSAQDNIIYQGRIGALSTDIKEFYWSGTSAKIKFLGSSLSFGMKDVLGNNYYHAILDGKLIEVIKPDTTYGVFTMLNDDVNREHEFELLRISEGIRGKSMFYGFDIGDGQYIGIPKKENTICFYGNSITAAYAVDDYSGNDSPDSTYTNFAHSYAKMTADHFDANYYAIVRSGIGISISWFEQLISDLYYRTDPLDSLSIWDYSTDNSDIIVVNLLQNDAMLIEKPDYPTYVKYFKNGKPTLNDNIEMYANFLRTLIKVHPKADIVCMLGNMSITNKGSIWPMIVEKAIESLNVSNVTTCFVPFKETKGHPNLEEQKEISVHLIKVIDRILEDRKK